MLTSKVFQCYALSPVIPFSIQIIHIKSLFSTNSAIACPWDSLSMVFSIWCPLNNRCFSCIEDHFVCDWTMFLWKTLNFRRILLEIKYMQKSTCVWSVFHDYIARLNTDWVSCCCGSKNIHSLYVVWLFLCVSLICNGNIAGVRIFLFIISLVK